MLFRVTGTTPCRFLQGEFIDYDSSKDATPAPPRLPRRIQ